MDLTLSLIGILLLSAPLLLLCILCRIFLGPEILFSQLRPGYRGKPFRIYKFRTMLNLYGPDGKLLPDEKRLTTFGNFLRSTSLDELPELINVLKGEMSLVGPRPLLMEYLDRYTTEQMKRHEMKPGITGWAQINGRNAQTWDERFAADLWYIQHWSLWLDLKIIWLTIFRVLARKDIQAKNHVTMPIFEGQASDRAKSSGS